VLCVSRRERAAPDEFKKATISRAEGGQLERRVAPRRLILLRQHLM
jgi:hypothetical protein